jgi:hypothetical protein
VLNWLIGPALMTGLAWATLPDLEGYRNGVILVRACTVATPRHAVLSGCMLVARTMACRRQAAAAYPQRLWKRRCCAACVMTAIS